VEVVRFTPKAGGEGGMKIASHEKSLSKEE